MKRAFFVLLACGCASPRATVVEIAAPLASTTGAPVSDEALLPRNATRLRASIDGAWAASFEREKTFAVYSMPEAQRVLLTWRVGKSHFVRRVGCEGDPSADEYPANHVSAVDLVVRARSETRTISFGELSGSPEPRALSWCSSSGWAPEYGDSASTTPSFASTFSIGIVQGGDDVAIVRDGATLHVLHRETSDGRCEETKQGPLTACEGFEWKRAADVRLPRVAEIWETVEQDADEKTREPFDCGMELWGERLIKR